MKTGVKSAIEDVGCESRPGSDFISIAPDALTLGAYLGNDDVASCKASASRMKCWKTYINHLHNHEDCNGKVGVVGFALVWSQQDGSENSGFGCSRTFYGGQPTTEDVPKIKAPSSCIYAALDVHVNEGWSAYEVKSKQQRIIMSMYPNANHGFHNDTTINYADKAAELAWKRTHWFFFSIRNWRDDENKLRETEFVSWMTSTTRSTRVIIKDRKYFIYI